MANQYQDFDPTPKYDAELAALQRKQAIFEALKMQALQQTQAPAPGRSGQFESQGMTNPGQILAQILQAKQASEGSGRMDNLQMELETLRNKEFAAGIQQFDQTSQDPNNARKAVYDALQSSNPQLRAFAQSRLNQEAKGLDLKSFTPGSVVVDQNSGKTFSPIQGNSQPAYEQVEIKGDLYQKTPFGLKKLDDAPKTNISNTVNMPRGESTFDAMMGRKEAERLSAGVEGRTTGLEGLVAISDAKKLLDKGIHTGIYAKLGMTADKLMAPLSEKNPERAQRTEEFISYIGNIVIPRMKDLGGSDTEEELKYMKQITAGEITVEENTLRRVLDSVEKKLRNKVKEIDRSVEAYKTRGNSLPTLDTGVMNPVPGENPQEPEIIGW